MGVKLDEGRRWVEGLAGHARLGRFALVVGASFYSALLTGSRVFSSLIFNKLVAVYFGPAGLAMVGQFQSFTAIAFGVTTGNITTAVVTLVASKKTEDWRRSAIGTSVICLAGATAVVALLVGFFAEPLSMAVFSSPRYSGVFWVFALLMVPLIVNVTMLAVVAGLGHTRPFVIINALTALLLIPVAFWMIAWFGLTGALISAAVTNAIAIGMSALWLLRCRPLPRGWLASGINKVAAKRLLKLTSSTLSTIVLIPLGQYVVRGFVLHHAGEESAGHWQAALKFGEVVLMIGSVMISVYLLPRFAAATVDLSWKALRIAVAVVGVLLVLAAVIASTAELLLPILYSPQFIEAKELVLAQLIGDALRVGAMVMQAALLCRIDVRGYVAIDVVFVSVLISAAWFLVPGYGVAGASGAVLLAGAAAFLVAMFAVTRRSEW